MALSSEKKKQYLAIGLAVSAFLTIVYSVFFSDSGSSSPKTAVVRSQRPVDKVIPGINAPISGSQSSGGQQAGNQFTLVSQPLELDGIGSSVSPQGGRNIFVYPPPPTPTPTPTPKPTPPPPPPPFSISGLNPANAIAHTADFTLTVFGKGLPTDSRVMINGVGYPTKVVNDTQLKASIPASAIANPGQLQVEVRGSSDPSKFFSNRIGFNVSAPPIPQYRYMGLIVKGGVSIAYLRDEGESDLQGVKVGQKLGSRWQIFSISPGEIIISDTTINIKHRIPFTGEGG